MGNHEDVKCACLTLIRTTSKNPDGSFREGGWKCTYCGRVVDDPQHAVLGLDDEELAYLRPEVRAFANLMEEELRKHDVVRASSWKTASARELQGWLEVQKVKLDRQIDMCVLGAPHHIPRRAAAIGNLAMMLADVCGMKLEKEQT